MFYPTVLEVPFYFASESLAVQYFVLVLIKFFYYNKSFDRKKAYKIMFLSIQKQIHTDERSS